MADKLSEEQKQVVVAWLNTRWKGTRACPICGSGNWTILDHLVTPTTTDLDGNFHIGGMGYPTVMVASNECGYTMYFNAVVVGLMSPLPEGDE